MSNCTMDKDILILAANKDLPVIKRIKVYTHIKKCADCNKEFKEYKQMSGLMNELPEYSASERLVKNIENKTGVKTSEPSILEDLLSIILYSRIKYAASASLVIVITGIILFRTEFRMPVTNNAEKYYSSAEIDAANTKTQEALSILGKFLNKTQDQFKNEILGAKVYRPLNKGINTVTDIFKNGDKNETN